MLSNLTVQFGMPIVKFHINPGKKEFPQIGDAFKVAEFVVPAKLKGPKSVDETIGQAEYHAGGAMGILPFHTIPVDKLVIVKHYEAAELVDLLSAPAFNTANLTVLASSPKVTLNALPATKFQHEEVISHATCAHNAMLAAALKPTICDAATVGKPESRAIFVDEKDPATWARHTWALPPTMLRRATLERSPTCSA